MTGFPPPSAAFFGLGEGPGGGVQIERWSGLVGSVLETPFTPQAQAWFQRLDAFFSVLKFQRVFLYRSHSPAGTSEESEEESPEADAAGAAFARLESVIAAEADDATFRALLRGGKLALIMDQGSRGPIVTLDVRIPDEATPRPSARLQRALSAWARPLGSWLEGTLLSLDIDLASSGHAAVAFRRLRIEEEGGAAAARRPRLKGDRGPVRRLSLGALQKSPDIRGTTEKDRRP